MRRRWTRRGKKRNIDARFDALCKRMFEVFLFTPPLLKPLGVETEAKARRREKVEKSLTFELLSACCLVGEEEAKGSTIGGCILKSSNDRGRNAREFLATKPVKGWRPTARCFFFLHSRPFTFLSRRRCRRLFSTYFFSVIVVGLATS